MNWLHHPLVTSVALSMFCCLALVAALVSPEHVWIYHHSGSPTPIFGGVLLDLAMTWAVFALVLFLAERFPGVGLLVWTGIVVILPLEVMEQARFMEVGVTLPSHGQRRVLFALAFVTWMAWVWAWRRFPQPHFDRLRKGVTTALGFAAIGSMVTIFQLLWCYHQAFAVERTPKLHQRTVVSSGSRGHHPRVVWILLDELSYQQVYGDRYPGLELPEFDRLASNSIVFTEVMPAAIRTRIAVPAMVTGEPVDWVRATATGSSLLLERADTKRLTELNPADTIFGDAIATGHTTGISGWYNPYCRILGPVLDRCFWTMQDSFQQGLSPAAGLLTNALAPWKPMLNHLDRRVSAAEVDRAEIQRNRAGRLIEYNELVASGDALLADDSIDLAFLHMPFPHPPGFYNRRTGQLTTGPASYLDNLALADRYLQHVRELLTARGEWDSTAVLITGDHSWRTVLFWRDGVDWTPEEQAASHGGQFEDRPAWILKLPGEQAPARIDTRFHATVARSLLRSLLAGGLKSPSEVAAFVESAPAAQGNPSVKLANQTGPSSTVGRTSTETHTQWTP